MRALILAAGFGTRMAPITETIPKPLLPVGGISAIRHNIIKLTRLGIYEIVINVHHLPKVIKNELTDIKEAAITFSEEKEILGTAGGIKKACDFLGGDDFLVINSDVLSEIDYQRLIAFHVEKKASCTLALRKDKEADQYGSIEIDKSGKIKRFLGKGFPGKYHKYMYTGIQVMNPRFLKNVVRGTFCDLSKEVYSKKVYEDNELFGFVTKDYWIDVGKPSPLLEANRHFIKLFSKDPNVTAEHVFFNKSAIHKNAKVAPSESSISSSLIEENVNIEAGVTIHNSIVMNGAKIKKGTILENSIIGPGTILGPGTFQRVVAANVINKLKINRF